jgi:hypothetical protein
LRVAGSGWATVSFVSPANSSSVGDKRVKSVCGSSHGIPDVYDLFSARLHDINLLDDFLGDTAEIIAFGYHDFICDPKRDQLAANQDIILIT